jgi:hypothetical protein
MHLLLQASPKRQIRPLRCWGSICGYGYLVAANFFVLVDPHVDPVHDVVQWTSIREALDGGANSTHDGLL